MKNELILYRQKVGEIISVWHYWGYDAGSRYFTSPVHIGVPSEQFTGQLDINKKKIFENDFILKEAQWSNGKQWDVYCLVVFDKFDGEEYGECDTWVEKVIKYREHNTISEWKTTNYGGWCWSGPSPLWGENSKIIGNLQDNPEILNLS